MYTSFRLSIKRFSREPVSLNAASEDEIPITPGLHFLHESLLIKSYLEHANSKIV